MPNLKDIKRRIHSVESTMQITKAMELVASSKFRRAKERAEASRPFFEQTYKLMAEIAAEDPFFNSEFVHKRVENGAVLFIVIAGDRGLAGGFNSNILRMAQARLTKSRRPAAIPLSSPSVRRRWTTSRTAMSRYSAATTMWQSMRAFTSAWISPIS